MRRHRIKQRLLQSFNIRNAQHSLLYTPSPRYSAILGSSDRLLFAHPDPATRSPSPASSAETLPGTTTSHTVSCQLQPSSTSQDQAGAREGSLSATVHRQRSIASPFVPRRCTHCTRHLASYEFFKRLPSAKCKHSNTACVYCVHNSVYTVFVKRGWEEVPCLMCGEEMSEEEASKLVLLWDQEGT
jgi:hypothetical protein